MARGRSWGRVSALLSIAGGAVLLLLVLANQRPVAETEKPPEVAEQNEPEMLDQAETPPAEPVALAAVMLPPPPAPKVPEPAPEAKVPDVPVVKVEPLRPDPPKPDPKPDPVHAIKPLKAEAVEPKPVEAPEPEPVHVIKPLKAEALKPEPVESREPVKPLVSEAKVEPESAIKPLRPKAPEPRPEPVEERVVEASPPVEPLRPTPRPRPLPAKTMPEKAPEPRPQPQPETVQLSVDTSGKVAQEGRALLRLLEHGSGPTIEIGWPRDSRERQRLYRTLAGCFGMKPILMDGSGNLYSQEGARGHKWEINLDRFSGFVRQPAGFVAPEERGAAEAIRRYHGLRSRTSIVRIFPRRVDAVLLGGLQQILGNGYQRTRAIHGTYRQIGDTLYVEDIVADGVPVAGRIAFANRRRCSI